VAAASDLQVAGEEGGGGGTMRAAERCFNNICEEKRGVDNVLLGGTCPIRFNSSTL
jgi:hypothetical protein